MALNAHYQDEFSEGNNNKLDMITSHDNLRGRFLPLKNVHKSGSITGKPYHSNYLKHYAVLLK